MYISNCLRRIVFCAPLLGASALLLSTLNVQAQVKGSIENLDSHDSQATVAATRIAPHQLGPIRDKLEHLDGSAESTNWSGYAVLGSSFTSTQGSWTVPATVCTGGSGDQYAAFWVGLDGYSSNTVEQTGTMSECEGRNAVYYAWYEFYPNPMYELLNFPVNPGNVISASVVYTGSNKFSVTITNESTGKSYTTSATVSNAARSSAEWITEAPCCTFGGGILPLSDFGTAYFGADYTGTKGAGTNDATDSTTSGAIGKFSSPVQINKVSSSTSPQTSTCSLLTTDGTSFSCVWAQ